MAVLKRDLFERVFFPKGPLILSPTIEVLRTLWEPRLAGGLIDASGTMSGGGGKVASGGMRPAGKKVCRTSLEGFREGFLQRGSTGF